MGQKRFRVIARGDLTGWNRDLDWRIQPFSSPNGSSRAIASDARPYLLGFRFFFTAFSWPPRLSTMTDNSQPPTERGGVLSALNMAINGLNFAKEVANVTPAKAAFGSVAILLAMIRVSFLSFCSETFHVHTYSGHHGQRPGLRRSRAVVC